MFLRRQLGADYHLYVVRSVPTSPEGANEDAEGANGGAEGGAEGAERPARPSVTDGSAGDR